MKREFVAGFGVEVRDGMADDDGEGVIVLGLKIGSRTEEIRFGL